MANADLKNIPNILKAAFRKIDNVDYKDFIENLDQDKVDNLTKIQAIYFNTFILSVSPFSVSKNPLQRYTLRSSLLIQGKESMMGDMVSFCNSVNDVLYKLQEADVSLSAVTGEPTPTSLILDGVEVKSNVFRLKEVATIEFEFKEFAAQTGKKWLSSVVSYALDFEYK